MNTSDESAAFRPLYQQIKEMIVARITSGEWSAGKSLPSEAEFARHYNVSPGTVRKAVGEMVAENLVERFRGRGTFVKSQTDEREHSHFFHVVGQEGKKILPATRGLTCARRKCDPETARRLDVPTGSRLLVAERLRLIQGVPIIFEIIMVSEDRFPGLCDILSEEMPNEMYPLYEELFGIRVIRAEEHLSAVAADEREAEALDVPLGSPLLEIDRIATTFDGDPVELRLSHCNTRNHHYLNVLY